MRSIIFILFSLIAQQLWSIAPHEKAVLTGRIIDSNANQALEYATISIFLSQNDSIVNGTISDKTGLFKIKDLDPGIYKVNVSFMGYESVIVDNINIEKGNKTIDLGNILLKSKSIELDQAVVISDQQQISYKLDRKVIHVNQLEVASSGTAVDILETYPTISVDIDGSVSLRGSTSFTVLIDNKPSILEPSMILNQIPASTIESIEIITNPSAKYSSEGTSGIINIITKKDKLYGFNGQVEANIGMYKNYGSDILFNFKKEKVSFYVGANITNRGIEGAFENESWKKINDTTFYLMSKGNYDRTKGSSTARGGIDFNLNTNNSLSFQTSIGDWNSGGITYLDYEEYSVPALSYGNYTSIEEPTRKGLYYNMDLRFVHNFPKKGHQITSLFYYDRRDFSDKTENELKDLGMNIIGGQKSTESGPANTYEIQIDYTLPINENQKFETGYKGDISNYDKESKLEQFNDAINDYELVNEFLYHIKLDKKIHSLYSIYTGEVKKLGYKIGLRAEYTDRSIDQKETAKTFNIERIDFFPTAHFSFDFTEKKQIVLSYSRRISRPKDWQLEPFYTREDAYNLRIGNPGLSPQYTDSYELSYIHNLNKHSISADVYYKQTDNSIEAVQSVYSESIYLQSYENIGTEYSLGLELSLNLSLFKWWKCNLSSNLYDYQLKGELLGQYFDKHSLNWNARMYNTFKIGKTTNIQLSTIYNGPTVTAQGDNQGYFITNGSISQDFLKDFSVSMQVTGVFGMLERNKSFGSVDFYIHNYIEPYTPILNFSISYKFRNYKYNRNRQQKNIDYDDGEGGL